MVSERALFNANVLKDVVATHLAGGRGPTQSQQGIIKAWHEKVSKGLLRDFTETQVEQAFNSAIFVELLGYVPLGKGETHHIVPKRTAATGKDIPDFVLGVFHPASRGEAWKVVGEIKSVGVDLDMAQTSRFARETPVQQAFRYALNSPGVDWIIITNFNEIRLYRNGYIAAYHRWTLKDLCNPDIFNEFFILLKREHLVPDAGPSETLRIYSRSQNVGIALTEGFYGLYDLARQRLIQEFKTQVKPGRFSEGFLYGKAHKLLNRILFAAFCEDHPAGLLPEGTLKRLHAEAKQSGKPGQYWHIFKNFFKLLNEGSPPGAPEAYTAFNGGLFAPDPFFDGIALPDEAFRQPIYSKTRAKSERGIEGVFGFHVYDFNRELDIESLGAIFEQSLKDLPYTNKSVRGAGETSVTRRETGGVYYTPKAITQYMVTQALEAFLRPIQERIAEEIKATVIEKPLKFGKRKLTINETKDYLFHQRLTDALKKTTILDPACGSGAFLVTALEDLHREYEVANERSAILGAGAPMFGLDRFILRNNLFGVDILPESVEITKLSIWLRTAAPKEPLEKLDQTISDADSLTMNQPRAYDLIISNPPWGADLVGWTDDALRERFPACGEEKDSYAVFTIRAHELLRPGGILAYIVPNSWLTVRGYAGFRSWFLTNFEVIEVVNVWKIFDDVNHDACIVVARKREVSNPVGMRPFITRINNLSRGTSEADKCQQLAARQWFRTFGADAQEWLKEPNSRFETIYEPKVARELDRVMSRSKRLGDLCDVTVGIQVYHQRKVSREIIETRAFHATHRKGPNWFSYITGNEVQRYFGVRSASAFLYLLAGT